jgi:hypothetical protein
MTSPDDVITSQDLTILFTSHWIKNLSDLLVFKRAIYQPHQTIRKIHQLEWNKYLWASKILPSGIILEPIHMLDSASPHYKLVSFPPHKKLLDYARDCHEHVWSFFMESIRTRLSLLHDYHIIHGNFEVKKVVILDVSGQVRFCGLERMVQLEPNSSIFELGCSTDFLGLKNILMDLKQENDDLKVFDSDEEIAFKSSFSCLRWKIDK